MGTWHRWNEHLRCGTSTVALDAGERTQSFVVDNGGRIDGLTCEKKRSARPPA